MLTEHDPAAVRYDADLGRPVAVGEQPLTQPTFHARTKAGFWGLFPAGDGLVLIHPGGALQGSTGELRERLQDMTSGERGQRLTGEERDTALALLPFLGGDDPGKVPDEVAAATRSRVQQGPPPTYRLSDPANAPPGPEREPG